MPPAKLHHKNGFQGVGRISWPQDGIWEMLWKSTSDTERKSWEVTTVAWRVWVHVDVMPFLIPRVPTLIPCQVQVASTRIISLKTCWEMFANRQERLQESTRDCQRNAFCERVFPGSASNGVTLRWTRSLKRNRVHTQHHFGIIFNVTAMIPFKRRPWSKR